MDTHAIDADYGVLVVLVMIFHQGQSLELGNMSRKRMITRLTFRAKLNQDLPYLEPLLDNCPFQPDPCTLPQELTH